MNKRIFILYFMIMISSILMLFSLWQIDVSVGALSIENGYVYQDGKMIDPLFYYESHINKAYIFLLSIIFFASGLFFLKEQDNDKFIKQDIKK